MKSILVTLILSIFVLSGCATWKGVKQDSSDVWDATKAGTSKAYKSTKNAIHSVTSE
jgi:predicted small secreted protein